MKNILYFGITEWHGMKQRSHHLARYLAQDFRVLHVNPCYYSLPGYLRDTFWRSRLRKSFYGIRQVEDNLYVADFPPLLPFGLSHPRLGQWNYRLLRPLIRRALNQLEMSNPVLWLSLPPDHVLIGEFGERFSIYDCMDRYAAFFQGRTRQRLAAEEIRLLLRCDVVLTSSEGLYEHCRRYHRDVHLIRNAVSDHFFAALHPPDTKSRSQKAGYVGTLAEWIDLELLVQVAQAYPQVEFTFIGPAMTNLSELERLPNVTLRDKIPHSEIPACVAQFDVGLIPFRVNDLTRDVNPIKLYEYMALGKPIVSTALPEVEAYRDLVYVAQSTQDFITQLGLALEEAGTGNALCEQRRSIARQNTWRNRADHIKTILQQRLENSTELVREK